MTRSIVAIVLTLLAAGALAGCGIGPRIRVEAPSPPEPELWFPAGATILEGFEIDPEPGPWRLGDRVLLGIRVTQAGRDSTLYLLTELVGPPNSSRVFTVTTRTDNGPVTLQSPTCRTRMHLYDEQGRLLQVSSGTVPTMILNCGPYEAAAEELRIQEALRRGERREDQPYDERAMRGYIAFIAFGQSSGRNRLLAGMVRRVVRRPPLLGLLLDRGLYLGWDENGPTRMPDFTAGPALRLPTSRLPLYARAGGRDAARAVLLAAPSSPPIGLCGGLIEATIQHPTQPGTRAYVRLLAAQRGTGEVVAALDPQVTASRRP